jgi:hypothetical protein
MQYKTIGGYNADTAAFLPQLRDNINYVENKLDTRADSLKNAFSNQWTFSGNTAAQANQSYIGVRTNSTLNVGTRLAIGYNSDARSELGDYTTARSWMEIRQNKISYQIKSAPQFMGVNDSIVNSIDMLAQGISFKKVKSGQNISMKTIGFSDGMVFDVGETLNGVSQTIRFGKPDNGQLQYLNALTGAYAFTGQGLYFKPYSAAWTGVAQPENVKKVIMEVVTVPTGTSDTNGAEGDIARDDSYIYVKTSVGWKRAALSTF